MDNRIKILQVAHGMETFGGVESFLLQYYQKIDKSKVKWDFLFCCNNTFEKYADSPIFDESKITALHALKTSGNTLKNYLELVKELNKYLECNDYDIIHINTTNVFLQFICAIGLKTKCVRVAHSHSARAIMASPSLKDRIRLTIKSIAEPILKVFIRKHNDYLFACSEVAGYSLFGKKGICSPKFKIIKNAIETDRYVFNLDKRLAIREKYNIDESINIYGTVGRLAESKNLLFMIDVFREIRKIDSGAVLWIIGEGPMRKAIEDRISDYGMGNCINLLGEQNNVADYLQAMDCFLFTTVYEGLGIVAIEAQASDLITVVSDAVPVEAKVTSRCKSIKLDKSASEWADEIIQMMNKKEERKSSKDALVRNGYDMFQAATTLCEIYQNIVDKEGC